MPNRRAVDGDREIVQVDYRPAEPDLPIEAFTLDSLLERFDPASLSRPERLGFNLVVLCTSGRGMHEVDFTEVATQPGCLLHVRPGQVHRWRGLGSFGAELVVFPDVVPGGRLTGATVTLRAVDPAAWAKALEMAEQVRQEHRFHEDAVRAQRALTLLRDLFIVRLGLDVSPSGEAGNLPAAYLSLRDELGTPPVRRSVASYANGLGYSRRTLTRACQEATGRTAKQIIDEQVLLEARRWLAHDGRPVSKIARQLGFTEATNFTKFFVHMTGETPRDWRDATHRTR